MGSPQCHSSGYRYRWISVTAQQESSGGGACGSCCRGLCAAPWASGPWRRSHGHGSYLQCRAQGRRTGRVASWIWGCVQHQLRGWAAQVRHRERGVVSWSVRGSAECAAARSGDLRRPPSLLQDDAWDENESAWILKTDAKTGGAQQKIRARGIAGSNALAPHVNTLVDGVVFVYMGGCGPIRRATRRDP